MKELGIPADIQPSQLTYAQRLDVYRAHADLMTVLGKMGGAVALEKIGDQKAAMALSDVLFRGGGSGGAKLLQGAINRVDPGRVTEDGKMGPETFEAFRSLAEDESTRCKMLRALADLRNVKWPHEDGRNEFFACR